MKFRKSFTLKTRAYRAGVHTAIFNQLASCVDDTGLFGFTTQSFSLSMLDMIKMAEWFCRWGCCKEHLCLQGIFQNLSPPPTKKNKN